MLNNPVRLSYTTSPGAGIDRLDGKSLMRRFNTLLIVLLLILGVSANNAFAGFCFCGRACPHGLQSNETIKPGLKFHMRCSGDQCKSCDLEKNRILKAVGAAGCKLDPASAHVLFIYKIPDDDPAMRFQPFFGFFKDYQEFESPPIYLRKLELRC